MRVPSLREHREDVPEIANLVLSQRSRRRKCRRAQFTTAALNALRNYDWPGNLLQLESAVQTLAQLALGDQIGVGGRRARAADAGRAAAGRAPTRCRSTCRCATRATRSSACISSTTSRKEGGNISRVAESVGLERTHLYRKLKQLGIKLPRRTTSKRGRAVARR